MRLPNIAIATDVMAAWLIWPPIPDARRRTSFPIIEDWALSNLALRVLSAGVLVPIVLALVWLGGWWFTALVVIAGILVLREWNAMTGAALIMLPVGAGAIAAAAILATVGMDWIAVLVIAVATLALWVIGSIRKENAGWIATGLPYAGLPTIALIAIRSSETQALAAMVFVFAAVWITDTAAYISGRAIGGPKLWPSVSPNKTWAGLIGGLAGAAIFGGVFAQVSENFNILWLVQLGAILALVSQGGDLFESSVKRRFGVKDSGNIIPGHGGVMDRVDGMVAAAIFAAMIGATRSNFDTLAAGLLDRL